MFALAVLWLTLIGYHHVRLHPQSKPWSHPSAEHTGTTGEFPGAQQLQTSSTCRWPLTSLCDMCYFVKYWFWRQLSCDCSQVTPRSNTLPSDPQRRAFAMRKMRQEVNDILNQNPVELHKVMFGLCLLSLGSFTNPVILINWQVCFCTHSSLWRRRQTWRILVSAFLMDCWTAASMLITSDPEAQRNGVVSKPMTEYYRYKNIPVSLISPQPSTLHFLV